MNIEEFIGQLWKSYQDVTPQAAAIHKLFVENGERVINDHVAFRTFDQSPINLVSIRDILESLGYTYNKTYHFEEKKLKAYSFSPPDQKQALIFASELLTEQLSESSRSIINELLAQIPETLTKSPEVLSAGLLWKPPTWNQYKKLRTESEYAAWLSTMGMRPNHFTISVNHLTKMDEIGDVLTAVRMSGFNLNGIGGIVKGSPSLLLEQGSTMADMMEFKFGDGECHTIPTCFYEFAKRYKNENEALFMGFIKESANLIFESTDQSST